MKVVFHRLFRKDYDRLSPKDSKKCDERISIFVKNPFDPLLNNHALRGEYEGRRSIDIRGDLRAVFVLQDSDTVALFVRVGTHPQLYG